MITFENKISEVQAMKSGFSQSPVSPPQSLNTVSGFYDSALNIPAFKSFTYVMANTLLLPLGLISFTLDLRRFKFQHIIGNCTVR